LWAAMNSLRQNLQGQGTVVTAVHVGYVDTDMAAGVVAPKTAPAVVAAATLDAVEAAQYEVLVDEFARHVRATLSSPLRELYPGLGAAALQ
jgi:NAD(P)-dependent dehydrogenase (short-subunit alcohol dehydrogenase family)